MMRRRDFITLLGGAAAAWPLAAHAQQPERMRRIGVLMNGPATNSVQKAYVAAFVEALRKLGWIEGQNLRIDIRWNAGDAALGRIYAAQLIGLQPEVILAATTANLEVVRQATTTVPVVFTQVSDPVAQGFVASLTKPGGNLTGFSAYEFSTGGKWLDLTRERQELIVELADRHRLPAISWDPEFPRAGGLMCYSVTASTLDQYRQAAGYVDRILKGTKPGDLPIQQADKYTLVINLKTAKALGLTVPLPLLGLADEVIE